MSKLVKIDYNLTSVIDAKLKEIVDIVIVDQPTLTEARKERRKLNAIINDVETERKAINKLFNDNFKAALDGARKRLIKHDENIVNAVTELNKKWLLEIKKHFEKVTDLNWELAPQDEFLKEHPHYKTKVKLWVSKIEHEKAAISAMGEVAVAAYEKTYDLATALASIPKEAPPAQPQPETVDDLPTALDVQSKAETYTTLTITVADSVKAEVIDYLESKGVIVG